MLDVISLELNEINFDFVERYIARGKLPTFAKVMAEYEIFETVAEDHYPFLEPWIQWPSVYNGKTYADHGLFRLGDVVGSGHQQIWEVLAAEGVTVGAISPMNAENRCPTADFFIPDPWTRTPVTGNGSLKALSALVSELVNGNAHEGSGMGSVARRLLPFVLRYASVHSGLQYARILKLSVRYKWARAGFLDRFLADVFLKLRRQKGTRFASLFLNAGAHIQHHHMFESAVYDGPQANPEWYSTAKDDGVDPLLFIYEVYDDILADMLKLPNTRVMVTTGLSQVANPKTIFQYRFTDHARSLEALGIKDFEIAPRMSRDFLLSFASRADTEAAIDRMQQIACDDKPFFAIEDRGSSLFCQISYVGPKEGLAQVMVSGAPRDLSNEIVLVSIENGIHQTIGYHFDTAFVRSDGESVRQRSQMPLTSIFGKMLRAASPTAGDERRHRETVGAQKPAVAAVRMNGRVG